MKKQIATLSFLFGFAVTTASDAFSFYITQPTDCAPVDLRTAFSLKMRNQGNISWCYAHAAADYIQYYARIPEQISAADVAIYYGRRRWPRFLRWITGSTLPETGLIKSAIYDLSAMGYCPEEYFPSEHWTKKVLHGKDAGKTVEVDLAKAVDEINSLRSNAVDGFYASPSDLPYIYEFKGVTAAQFHDVIFYEEGNVFDNLRSAACDSHRKPLPKMITHVGMSLKGKRTFQSINQILDEGTPVTVDFFYGVLENQDSYKRSFADLHTTLLMARRYDAKTEECQYLIKNSYGEDCSSYDKRNECEAGYVWLSESALFGAMTSYVYIDGSVDFIQTGGQIQDEPESQSAQGVL